MENCITEIIININQLQLRYLDGENYKNLYPPPQKKKRRRRKKKCRSSLNKLKVQMFQKFMMKNPVKIE